MKVYQELLKNVGVTSAPVSGILNADRLKGAVAGSIKHAIADDGRLQTSMRDSFRQLIRSGNLDTVEATSKKVELRTGKIMWVRRVVTSSKACDFCHLLAGTWFKASDGKAAPRQFHDSCTCKLEMKIDSPEVEDFEFDLDDDFEDFEF